MPQKPIHTAPPPSSKAAANGSEHVQSLASHGVALSHTVTKLTLSSSWITDASGNVNQYLQYLPFGEQFIDQRQKGHDIRFKFTGKERDAETGMDYFGARYYSSDLSVWLSVDPLAFKYPNESPYIYVGNRPINTIDPWGMDKVEDPNGNSGEAGDYKQTADKKYLHGKGMKTKVWDPKAEGQGNQAGVESGAYVDYDGDAIDFDSYGSNSQDGLKTDVNKSVGQYAVNERPGVSYTNNYVSRVSASLNTVSSVDGNSTMRMLTVYGSYQALGVNNLHVSMNIRIYVDGKLHSQGPINKSTSYSSSQAFIDNFFLIGSGCMRVPVFGKISIKYDIYWSINTGHGWVAPTIPGSLGTIPISNSGNISW